MKNVNKNPRNESGTDDRRAAVSRSFGFFVNFSKMGGIGQGVPKKKPVSQKSKIFLIYSVMIRKVK